MKYLIWILPFFLFSCGGDETQNDFEVIGMKPIYLQGEAWDAISVQEAQPIKDLGKIFYKDNYLYVNEVNKGIHVIDNSDPANPNPVKFIKIWGNRDIAIKGNILYVDNLTDLVAIDISDLDNIVVTKRITNLYNDEQFAFPENHLGFFECVDPSSGTVIGWEETQLLNPECRR